VCFYIFEQCIIIYIFKGKNHYHIKEEEVLKMGIALYFQFFFCLVMFHEPQTWGPTIVKNYNLYIVCTLIWSNPLHLTIGSWLILIQSEFWVLNVVMQINFFLLMFKIARKYHQNFSLLHTYNTCYTLFFWWKAIHP
jgi:hypothetical protein